MRKPNKSEKAKASLSSVAKEINSAKRTILKAVRNQTSTAIIPAPALELASPPSAQQVQEAAERQIQIRKGYIKLIAQNLRPENVLVFGGNKSEEVYIPKNTAMNVLAWARVEIEFDGPMEEHRYQSPDGEFAEFVINATVTDGSGRSVPVIGNRSTRDEFFGIASKEHVCPTCKMKSTYGFPWDGARYESWYCKDHPKARQDQIIHYLPLHDVDIASVRQAAVANLWNHALEAIGLRPTLLDLKEAGMDVTKVKMIGFGSSREEEKPEKKAAPAKQAAQKQKQDAPIMETEYVDPEKSKCAECGSSFGVHLVTCSKFKNPGMSGKPPEKATIPDSAHSIKGEIEAVHMGKSSGGSPYRRVIVKGTTYFIFDNKEKLVDGSRKVKMFDVLDAAVPGMPCEFMFEIGDAKGKKMSRITNLLRVGNYEWELDSTPVLRRDSAEQLPFREPGE